MEHERDSGVAASGGVAETVREWIRWFGISRLVLAGLSVAVVAAGAYWLLRAPTPPVEGSLPWSSTVPSASADQVEDSQPSSPSSPPPPTTIGAITVHVAGAVVEPGVYELLPGARVEAALASAGGARADADHDALNLAAPVADGSRLFVPVVGEDVPATIGVASSAGAEGDATPAAPLDINDADRDALDTLPGVGPATADAIVIDRETNGPFATVDDLERVPGIGPAKVARFRDLVRS